jgi:hypothetical protein
VAYLPHRLCQLDLGKDKIRFAEYCRVATPASDALAAEEPHESPVTMTLNVRKNLSSNLSWRWIRESYGARVSMVGEFM